MLKVKKGNSVWMVSQSVFYSESKGRVFSGVSNDLDRLKKWVEKKVRWEVERGCNNPEAQKMVVEKWK